MTNPTLRKRNNEEKREICLSMDFTPSDLETPENIKKKVMEIPGDCELISATLASIEACTPSNLSVQLENDDTAVNLLTMIASTQADSTVSPQRAGNIVKYEPTGRDMLTGTGLNLAIDNTTKMTAGLLRLTVRYIDPNRGTGYYANYIPEPGDVRV